MQVKFLVKHFDSFEWELDVVLRIVELDFKREFIWLEKNN